MKKLKYISPASEVVRLNTYLMGRDLEGFTYEGASRLDPGRHAGAKDDDNAWYDEYDDNVDTIPSRVGHTLWDD